MEAENDTAKKPREPKKKNKWRHATLLWDICTAIRVQADKADPAELKMHKRTIGRLYAIIGLHANNDIKVSIPVKTRSWVEFVVDRDHWNSLASPQQAALALARVEDLQMRLTLAYTEEDPSIKFLCTIKSADPRHMEIDDPNKPRD